MKTSFYKIISCFFFILPAIASIAQDVNRTLPPGYDPHYDKIIPDKVFEIGLPLLVLYLIANLVVSIFKIRAESRLKEKALDKQLSEPTLIALFAEDKSFAKYNYLKWFLILAALGISFIAIQLLANADYLKSGYMAVGIISLYLSVAFLIYYYIIRKK
jgi:hypothetical protein